MLFSFPCKDSTRYYVAVRSSGKRVGPASGDERINSGWNLFIDSSSGVPLTVATGRQEGVSAQAHYLYRNSLNSGLDKAVGFFSFALNSPTNCSFEFKQNNTVLISIDNLGAITNGSSLYKYGNISEAISAGNTDMKFMVLVRPNGDTSFFNVFALLENLNPADSLIYKLKSVPTNKIVSEGDLTITDNSGLENIINTTYQLCRIPSYDTINPVLTPISTYQSVNDSTLIRFLTSAVTHLALAHNSPQSDENEEFEGIFTNYIQYFDNLMRNWRTVNDSAIGLSRFRAIFNNICSQNKDCIVDPVWAESYGTVAEASKTGNDRKNYAFNEGYSLLEVDLTKPFYINTCGAGFMLTVSENVEIYSIKQQFFCKFDMTVAPVSYSFI